MLCDLCGNGDSVLAFSGRDLLLDEDRQYDVRRCTECGLYRLDPQPDDAVLKAAYPDSYWRRVGNYVGPTRLAVRLLDRLRSSSLRNLIDNDAVVLDVGCGDGSRLSGLAGSASWRLLGIEPNANEATKARARGIEVFDCLWEEATVPEGSTDVILMHHVLEHLRSPRAGLKKSLLTLKPSGLLVIDLPNVGGLEASVWRQFWFGWELPRHLYAFSPTTIRRFLRDIGFDIESLNHQAIPADWIQSLQSLLRSRRVPPRLIDLCSINNFLLLALFQPAAFLGKLLGRSGRITVIARKPWDTEREGKAP